MGSQAASHHIVLGAIVICMHKIGLLGSLSYVVADSQQCMPLQAIIVNTIFDLPVVENGASTEEIKYGDPPVSQFETQIHGQELKDHNISKEMDELNQS
ncbi:unnamed protein product [Sphagnum compactum]